MESEKWSMCSMESARGGSPPPGSCLVSPPCPHAPSLLCGSRGIGGWAPRDWLLRTAKETYSFNRIELFPEQKRPIPITPRGWLLRTGLVLAGREGREGGVGREGRAGRRRRVRLRLVLPRACLHCMACADSVSVGPSGRLASEIAHGAPVPLSVRGGRQPIGACCRRAC